MPSRINAVRPMRIISATGAVVGAIALLTPAAASAAGATTIYACVSKKNGAMRIVSAKAKCKRGEHKLSWGASGPAGAPGATGAAGSPGAAGANGVGVDYASSVFGPTELAASEVVITKTIPAGSYFVNAKTVVGADAKTEVFVGVICELVDTSGTVGVVELPQALDLGEWQQQLSKSFGTEYDAATTLAMQAQLTTTEPTTLGIVCVPVNGSKEAEFFAAASQLSALQTTADK
jgi:hypothetical protein